MRKQEKSKRLSRWMYIALAAVLVVALGVTAVLLWPKEEVPVSGPEAGVYYYEAEMGDYLLSMLDECKFSMILGSESKQGSYTVEGEAISFVFSGEEAVGATAVLKNDVLTLTYGTSEMRFLKKIPYTVTFNANGGSTVAGVSVINGKKVAKPSDPTKAGNVFLGWYADEALTKAYNFLTDMVTSDTTLYARWAEKPEGQPEYLVNFHMGYEAEAPAAMQTIGGKLYDLVTPEREGYTFGGWWISIYQDAERLSYQYTEDTVFDANTTLYATWLSDTTGSKLQAPQVSIDKNGAKWPAVSNASSYEVTVVNAATNKQVLKETATATVYTIPFADLDAGDYIVTVKAKANVETNDSAETVRYYKNKGLGRVSQFTVIDPATILFNAVENATDYYITVVCGNKEHNHSYFYNGNSTNFNFASCTMTEEGISFTVTATAEGYASSESETFVYKRMLESVTGLKVDSETQTVSWNAVANAGGYVVTVTDATGEHVINANGLSCSLEAYTAGESGITVSVVPVTNGYISPAAATVTYNKTKLATPSIIGIDDTVLSWTEVPGASAYVVKLGNQEYRVEGTSYDFAELLDILEEHYTFRVKAVSDSSESTYSKELNATYLIMNTEISYKNNVVTWSPVIGAGYYMVQVNDEYAQRVDGSRNSFEITLTKPGINIITVTSNVTEEKATTEVYAYTVELDSRAGSSVKPVYVAMGDKINFPETDRTGYDFVAWYTTPGGPAGNGAAYEDAIFNGTGDMMLFAHWAAKSFNITFTGDGFEAIEDTKIKYDSTYTLPVPVSSDKTKMFAGWYTDIDGVPTKLTDADGNGVGPFNFVSDRAVYAYWAQNVLKFTLNTDGESYAVSAGANIRQVSKVYIPETHEGKPVTVVEAQGFAYNYYLREISIPNTVTLIGSGAFSGCSRLENIEVYEVAGNHEVLYWSYDGGVVYKDNNSGGVKTLQFFPSAKTGSYTIPEDVQNIAPMVFQQAQISEIVIPASVTTIAASAFRNATKLEVVKFRFAGNVIGTLTIDETAFTGCNAIREFYLPAQAATVTVNMFRNMPALEKIVVEEGNTAYSSVDGMLCSADAVGKTLLLAPRAKGGIVTISTSIHSVADNAFAKNREILRVVIPNHLSSIGASAFSGCTGILNVIFEGTRYTPLEIGANAFSGLESLKEVTFEANTMGKLDDGAVTIGAYAFANNTRLTGLTVGDGVNIASVGDYAFANNGRLGKIVISDAAAIVEIGKYAFRGNTALREIVIHASTTTIGSGAYSGCSYVTEVSFAEGGKEVSFGSNVFENCDRLATINIPVNVTAFDGSAFMGCNGITTITVDPANPYLTAEDGVLYDKAKTTLMYYPKARAVDFSNLPDTLTTFGPAVFQDNQMIVNVEIPAGITDIGAYAFENCINLESVSFAKADAELSLGKYAFANCGKLQTIALPAKTTELGDGLFSHTPIAAITIPETVTSIGAYAFEYTYITEVTIPAATTYVGSEAFANCQKLTSVTFAAGGEAPLTLGTEGMETSIFDGSNKVTNAIELPARTAVINAYAFVDCKASVSFAEVNQIVTVGDYAFQNANVAATVKLPNVVTIGMYAFNGTKITGVELGNKLEEIGFKALANMQLTDVTFAEGNNGVKLNIADFAFAYNEIVTIDLPARVANIGSSEDNFYTVFYGMGVPTIDAADKKITEPAKSYVVKSENVAYKGVKVGKVYEPWASTLTAINIASDSLFYGSDDGVVYRRDESGNMSTLVYAPRGKTGSYEVKLGTKWVVSRAFNATSLTEIIFADYEKGHENYGKPMLTVGTIITSDGYYNYEQNVTIGNSAVLQKIQFPSTLASLGLCAVGYTKSLDTLTFKVDGAPLSIGALALGNINNYNRTYSTSKGYYYTSKKSSQYDTGDDIYIDELKLPAVTEMRSVDTGEQMPRGFNFRNANIRKVTFGEGSSFTEIARNAFENCTLDSFVVPASVTIVAYSSFYNCKAMKQFTFEEGSLCAEIGGAAFSACSSLTAFTFPDNIVFVGTGGNPFVNCSKLTTVTLGKNMSVLHGTGVSGVIDVLPNTLKTILVPEENPYFCSIDGVVFSKDKSTLVYYPQKKTASNLTTNSELVEAWSNLKSIGHFALYNYKGQLTLPETLEYIGYRAFYGNTKLTSLHIPATVKEIAEYAFNGCSAMKTLTFAEGSNLETIGGYAFGSTKITEVTLPASLKNLGPSVFHNGKLTKLVIPEGITTFDNNFFTNMQTLEEVVLPSGLQIIGASAFEGLSKLKTITIPASVHTIGSKAFANCPKLASITFEKDSRLQVIGHSAFSGCSALKEVILPESVIVLQESGTNGHTFLNCTSLEKVVLPATLGYIPQYMFAGCTALKTVVMPETAGKIGDSAFENCVKLESIDIPALTESIGECAFQNCAKLEAVNIPATVKSIGDCAFDGCTGLKTIHVPEDSVLESLGTAGEACYIFRNTTSLEYFYMPDGVIRTGDSLFENSGIKEIRLSANLQTIAMYTFKNCVNLAKLTLPATIQDIEEEGFYNCASLAAIELVSGLSTIGDRAFQDCRSLTVMDLPSGVTILGSDVFRDCSALTSVVLPDTLEQMDGSPFLGCSSMEDLVVNTTRFKFQDGILYDADCYTIIYVPATTTGEIVMIDTVREIAPGAFAGTKITSVVISDYVEVVPADAFFGCSELERVTISNNVKSIGDRAFDGCEKLESMFIPKNVESIGEAAFRGCTSMSHPVFEERNTRFTLGARVFENCKAITEIKLPEYFTRLPDYAYAGTGITELVIPEYVTDLSSTGTFMNCTELKTVVWHEDISGELGSRLFMNTGLESIEIPEFITSLGTQDAGRAWANGPYYGETFRDCKQLTSVTFADGSELETVYGWTFAGCEKLTTVEFDSAMDIEYAAYAFAGAYFTELTLYAENGSLEETFGKYEGEGTSRNDYCPTLKKLTAVIYEIYDSTFDGIPNVEEISLEIYGDIDRFAEGLFYQLTEKTTVYVEQMGYPLSWDEVIDWELFDLSGGVIVYLDGVRYGE